jgi:Uma2 family endonuclease
MATNTRWMTAEELLALPEDRGRGELVDGEFHAMNPPSNQHGKIMGTIARLIGQHVHQNQLGDMVVGDSGFIVSRDPDTVLGPDVAFTRAERLPTESTGTYSEVIPDLIVEIISPGNTRKDVEEKTARWLAAGVSVVWNVRSDDRTVSIHMSDGSAQTLSENDDLAGGDVLPGFTCRVSEFFP